MGGKRSENSRFVLTGTNVAQTLSVGVAGEFWHNRVLFSPERVNT